LASSYISISQYDSAIYVLNKLIILDSTELDIYFDRAYCLKKLEKYQDAIKDCSHIINLKPLNIESICLLAECKYSLGDTTGAYNSLNAGYSKTWHLTEEGYFIRGSINLHYKKYDPSIMDFDEVINLNPKRAEALIYRGLCYFCKEDYKNAKSDLTLAINLDNTEIVGLYTRGLVNIKLNKLNEAWSDLTKAQSLGHPLARRAILLYLKNYKPPEGKS
jgi:tetratricopeptide (TPR) repeat protein